VAPKDGPDEDFVGDLEERVLLGYDSQYNRIITYDNLGPQSLEEYLLEFKTKWWQKFLAKHFGFRLCLGFLKKVGHAGYMDWFLFWCERCKRFRVNYKQGFDGLLDCQVCQKRFLILNS